ncbi:MULTISPECIES: hypothetical protein [Myroides]|uniref:Uncharacterized protein n=1 Tax=Myroides albus TaxID=2562892 RepID=A0A6I3LN99_9FLAO|nr:MULTISPECIES: hypothetical protein [Myroides]MTG97652.1 hypothetical protein [Myroides albus]MVX36987.1 hypothetical protein [Myroides sp. LoEW2-1]
MKKKLLLLSCLFAIGLVNAQESQKRIGIGVSLPDPSAILHVESTDKGVLIPNVVIEDLSKKDPIEGEIKESLLVYNNDATHVAKGYYYWTTNAKGDSKWVRVITSDDASEILGGQIQEKFTIEEKDIEKYVLDTDGKIKLDAQGQPETETLKIKGLVVYAPDKLKPTEDIVNIDVPEIVKESQTLTSFELGHYLLYHYDNGKSYREPLTPEEELDLGTVQEGDPTTELELIFRDENQNVHKYAVRDLLGADNEEVKAITKLDVNSTLDGLDFTDDKGTEKKISLVELVKNLEAKTSLDITADDELIYINELGGGSTFRFSLRTIVREPWRVAETNKEATLNSENIFTQGWVGVGVTAAEAQAAITSPKPDEKLRVNGSIYARNSYYADYVFENYFTKEASSLKYDYNFKDLSTVESFIKENYHLPGITPVSALDKSSEEGYLINVSELSIQLLEKVEELYLHTIDQHKIINEQREQLKMQEDRLQAIEEYLKQLK